MKSRAAAGASAVTSTSSVVSTAAGVLSRAPMVLTPPFSAMPAGFSTRVTAGAPSSSVMVTVRGAGAATPRPPATAPVTRTILFGPSQVSSRAVMVTLPVLVVLPAAMVSSVLPSVKSAAVAGACATAAIVTVVSSDDGWPRRAVTLLSPPFSPITAGPSTSLSTGVGSSSVIVRSRASGCST